MPKLPIGVLSGLILIQAVPIQAQDRVVNFSIGNRQFSMPVPEGYCTPEGELVDAANAAAEIDTMNVTLTTLFACNEGEMQMPVERYILVKTPRFAVHELLEKVTSLQEWEMDLRGPDAEGGAQIEEGVEDSYQRMRGENLELDMTTRLLGRDEECVYLGGRFATESSARSILGRAVTCMTVRGRKAININLYDLRSDEHVVGMRSATRSIAISIEAVR